MTDPLSPIETVMWRVGQDPGLRMTVGDLLILDRAPARADLVDRFRVTSEYAERLRQRPGDPSYVRRRPHWATDPDFDPDRHVRTITIPAPGDLRQVLDVVALIEPVPFDPERPPWDATLIDGLDGGKAALFLRAHHVLTDGFGGASIVSALVDQTRQGGAGRAGAQARGRGDQEQGGMANSGRPGTVTIDLNRAMRPLASGVTATLNAEPGGMLVRGVQRGLDVANSVSRQVLIAGGPLGSWADARSMTSRFEVLSVPGARPASLGLGGSRNTLLVAAAASGLGLYLERHGAPSPELRLATPASLRHSSEVGGNWFAPIRVEVPTAAGHPGPQFGVVAERLARARSEPALSLTSALAATISRLPIRLLIPALHAQADTVDFAATTLPGSRSPRHLCGTAIEQSYPFGPRLGCPLNISAFGNEDRLDIGIAVDSATVSDPELLLDCLRTAFASFVPAVQSGREPAAAGRAARGGTTAAE
jgi:diacylglycerol O-acyltransferase / wax synthase